MTPYDFIHLVLLAVDGKIQGRTKLQKTVYFLGILTGNLDDLAYRPHFYGPYSDSVASAVNRLKSLGFVQESSLHTGTVNSNGFEIARHDFQLTDEGQKIAEQKATQNAAAWKKIQHAVGLFRGAGDIDYMRMSIAAKAYFMLSEKGKPASATELSESAKKLGWDPKPAEIAESIGFLEKLALVTKAKVIFKEVSGKRAGGGT
jgi:hypothetical protein